MGQTGEPYAAARRAVVSGHQDGSGQTPPPGAGCALRMSSEIRDWLAGLRDSDPAAARTVAQALAVLLNEGARLGEPLVASTAGSWPPALAEGLDRSYREKVQRLTAVRRGAADAATLAEDIRKQAADLESVHEKLQDLHRRCWARAGPKKQSRQRPHWPRRSSRRPRCSCCCRRSTRPRRRLGEELQRLQNPRRCFPGPERNPKGWLYLGGPQPPDSGEHYRHRTGRRQRRPAARRRP